MSNVQRLGFLSILVFVTCLPKVARAGCWDYYNVPRTCTGAKGCRGEYITSMCTFGCVSGDCVDNGNSGSCCGHIYYNAQISGDGGDCDGFDCGDSRVRPVHPRSEQSRHGKELWRGAVLGQVELGDGLTYRPPRLLFVPDRCARRYAVVVEEKAAVAAGGM